MTDTTPQIDVYPVGVLAGIKQRRFRQTLRYVARQVRARNWRAVRNSFNGYLAEVSYSDIRHTRCGRGWTKRAALSSLGRRLGEDNRR